jgi:hypothetical protein
MIFLGLATPSEAADCAWLRRIIPDLRAQCGAGRFCPDLEALKTEAKRECGNSYDPSEAAGTGGSTAPTPPSPSVQAPQRLKPSKCDPATNDQIVEEARAGIERVERFMDDLRSSGLPVPPALLKAMKTVTRASKIGVELGHAAGQVDHQVREIVKDQYKLCEGLYDEVAVVQCEVKVARMWQIRNVRAVFNIRDPGSFLNRAVNRWFERDCEKKYSGKL